MRIVISGATGSIGSRLMDGCRPSHDVVGLGSKSKENQRDGPASLDENLRP